MTLKVANKILLRNIITILLVSAAFLSAGAVCFTGILKTTPELGEQTLWFIRWVVVLLLSTGLLWAFNRRRVVPSAVDAAATGFFLWYLFCYYSNGSIAVSALLELCFLAFTYLSFRVLFSSWRYAEIGLFVVLCVCGSFEAVTGIKQALGMQSSEHHLFGVTGTFFNPGPYSGYLAIIFAAAFGYIALRYKYASNLFARFKNLKGLSFRRVLWALCFVAATVTAVTILVILPSTMSRAALVAVVASVAAILLSERRMIFPHAIDYIRKHKKKCITIGMALVLLLGGGAYGIYAVKKDSADGRLLMWKISVKVVLDNPLTGVGPGYFRGAYGDTQAEYFCSVERSETEKKIAGSPEYGFNEYLQIGVETGMLGLVLFLVLVVTAFWRLFRNRSSYAFGLIALLVFAFFSYPFSILPLKVLLVLFLGAAGSQRTGRRLAKSGEMALVGIILAAGMVVALLLIKPFEDRIGAVKEWRACRQWYSMEYYSYVLEDYPELFPLMKENPAFLFEYGRSLHMEREYQESLNILYLATSQSADPMIYNVIGNNHKMLNEYDLAAKAYSKAHYMVPHRVYPFYLQAKMYAEIGDAENAVYYSRRVLDMTPKIESPATREMRQEMEELLQNGGKEN